MNNLIFLLSSLLVASLSIYCARSKQMLISWIALMGILANLFVLKQIELFGLHATASDVFAVGSLLGLNLLREYYDLSACKQAIFISFVCMLFFTTMGQIHLLYTPSPLDQSQHAYQVLLEPNPRIMLASMLVFFSVQIFDVYFYSFVLKKLFSPLWVRNGVSLVISQGLDTVLFTYIGLYGILDNLIQIVIISYTIKLISIACMTPLTGISKKWINAS